MLLSRLGNRLGAFACDEQGAVAIEYGLIAAGISLAIIAVVYQFGSTLAVNYSDVDQGLKNQ